VDRHLARREVASVSGALCAIRREAWDAVGGFDPDYFAYHEDVDLSLRVWCSGRKVRYVPEARCVHHYEFSRHPRKLELLERHYEQQQAYIKNQEEEDEPYDQMKLEMG